MKHVCIGLVVCIAIFGNVFAETPRFRGPSNDGKYLETGLLTEWPPEGPPVAWVTEGLGEGYSSVSASGERLYATGLDAAHHGVLYVMDLSGAILSRIVYGPETRDDWAPGPRSTPVVEENRVYVMSGPGVVYAMDVAAASVLWQVDVFERFVGKNITWSLAESLLLDDNRIICTPGGESGVVVALDKMTGDTVWTLTGLPDRASYCSPTIITHGGRRILVTMTDRNVVGLEPETGGLLWKHEHRTKHDIHAVTPVYADGLIYYSSGYDSGGGALELSTDGASVTQKWFEKTLDCQHHGVVVVDGYLYGTAHRGVGLVCIELATGEVMWTSRDISQGNVVYADGMLYVYEGPRAGKVSLIKPSPEGLDIKGQFTVTAGTEKHWPHPTIANGLLIIRRGDAVVAYDVRAK